jgi:arylsulfatase A-like enzyme
MKLSLLSCLWGAAYTSLVEGFGSETSVLIITSYAWGDQDQLFLNSSTNINLRYQNSDFTLAAANPIGSYTGILSSLSQGDPKTLNNIPAQNLHSVFKQNGYMVGHFGNKWGNTSHVDAQVYNFSQYPPDVFDSTLNFINEQQQTSTKFLATVFIPRFDINFIPNIPVNTKVKCRVRLPQRQQYCVQQAYGTSRQYEAYYINKLISAAGPNTAIVWFSGTLPEDVSVHGFATPMVSSLTRRDSLYGMGTFFRSNFPIDYAGPINAIDLGPTFAAMVGIKYLNVDGINLLDASAIRIKELSFFTAVAALGHCMFWSPPFARITMQDGKYWFQTWGKYRNEVYTYNNALNFLPAPISISPPFIPDIDITGCELPNQPLVRIAATPVKPKIFITLMLDDFGTEAQLSNYAPNLSKYAPKAVRARNFHSNVECSPSRASFFTSLMPNNKKVGINYKFPWAEGQALQQGMPPYLGAYGPISTLSSIFNDNGYESHLTGKGDQTYFHTVEPTYYKYQPDFECYECNGPADQFLDEFDYYFPQNSSRIIFENGKQQILSSLAKGKPTFVHLAFKTMHSAILAAADAIQAANASYVPSEIPGTPRFYYPTPAQVQKALIYNFDVEFGKFMAFLETVAPNDYIVLLSSDNGVAIDDENGSKSSDDHNSPFRGKKHDTWEGGHRLITYLWGTGFAGDLNQLTSSLDVVPTFLDFLGPDAVLPPDMNEFEGVSLKNLILNNDASAINGRFFFIETRMEDDDCFSEGPRFMICYWEQIGNQTFDWRLGLWSNEKTSPANIKTFTDVKLYNVQNDLLQKNDLSAQQPAKVKQLTEMVRRYRNYCTNCFPSTALDLPLHDELTQNRKFVFDTRCRG